MKIRGEIAIPKNSQRYDEVRLCVLDLYILYGNATLCYEIYRRTITGGDYKESRANANNFFKRADNVEYMERRKLEIWKDGFEKHAQVAGLDISEFKKKDNKYYDMENLSPDELRTKNLTELEDIKNSTTDENLRVQIIKQQTDLMDAKRKSEDIQRTDTDIKYYLPYPKCPSCNIDFSEVIKKKGVIK